MKYNLINEYEAMLGCKGMTFIWTRSQAEAVIFTSENLGPKRADDFHKSAKKWGKNNSLELKKLVLP